MTDDPGRSAGGSALAEDELLFAAALAHPAEDTPRLVLADWFDEHDEPEFASALRAGPEMIAYLGELIRWNATPVRRSHVYENGAVRDLFPTLPAAQLLVRYMNQFPVPPGAQTTFDVSAPPPRAYGDPLNPAAFLVRWQYEHGREINRLREQAARTADAGVPVRAFESNPGARRFEEQCCLLHELVLRWHDVQKVPGALDHHARMCERGHELAWLSLRLPIGERELVQVLPRFGPNSAGFNHPTTSLPLAVQTVGPGAPAVVGTEEFAPEAPVFAAVRWWNDSNGEVEGRAFRLDAPLDPDAVGRLWFSRLPADSLNAALVTASWFVNRSTFLGALIHLFASAHNGGAYGGGEWGAYGRLRAWQTFGALVGCAPTATADEIMTEAVRCEWLSFGGTDWFYQLPPDIGLICVRPDRLSVALLAATDTD